MGKPKRIQRKRTKGWRMPEGAVYVGRPTKWGNPFDWREWLDSANDLKAYLPCAVERERWCRERAVEEYEEAIREGTIAVDVTELRGKDLACWCDRFHPCHADVLLELANKEA